MSAIAPDPATALAAPQDPPLLLAPTRTEAWALRRRSHGTPVMRVGIGPKRAARSAAAVAARPAAAVVLAGFGGGLRAGMTPGALVIADRILLADGSVRAELPGAAEIAARLRHDGITAEAGAVVSVERVATGAARAALAGTGALIVEMEAAWLLDGAAGRPFAVVRAVLDTPEHELWRPVATLGAVRRAVRTLGAAAALIGTWAGAAAPPSSAPSHS